MHSHHFFCICSSGFGHLGCIHILALVNNAAMYIRVHVSFQISVFAVRIFTLQRTTGSYGSSVFSV